MKTNKIEGMPDWFKGEAVLCECSNKKMVGIENAYVLPDCDFDHKTKKILIRFYDPFNIMYYDNATPIETSEEKWKPVNGEWVYVFVDCEIWLIIYYDELLEHKNDSGDFTIFKYLPGVDYTKSIEKLKKTVP